MSFHIRFVKRHDIDEEKWNALLLKSDQATIYNSIVFLDVACPNWGALVVNEYEYVFPLPMKKKWGITYLFHPPLLQRIELIGVAPTEELVNQIWQRCKKDFLYIDIPTSIKPKDSYTQQQDHTNFIIPLNRPYDLIQSMYSTECKDNIEKAKKREAQFEEGIPLETIIAYYQRIYGSKSIQFNEAYFKQLKKILQKLIEEGYAFTAGVRHKETGEWTMGAVIGTDHNRLYYLFGAPNETGRKMRATYFFIDQLLHQHANTQKTFDFEGSDIPEVAAFYQKFSPQSELYVHLHFNRLPIPYRWFKK